MDPTANAASRNLAASRSWRRSGLGRGRGHALEPSWERYVQAVYVVNVVAARAICNYKVRAPHQSEGECNACIWGDSQFLLK